MLLKKEPAYRKAEKEDFPLIRELSGEINKDRWEFEEAHTEKRLTRLLFYTYMISRDSITVATYRDQVVGVLITGKGSKVRFAPVFRLKKAIIPAPETYQRRPQESGTFQQTSGYEKTN